MRNKRLSATAPPLTIVSSILLRIVDWSSESIVAVSSPCARESNDDAPTGHTQEATRTNAEAKTNSMDEGIIENTGVKFGWRIERDWQTNSRMHC